MTDRIGFFRAIGIVCIFLVALTAHVSAAVITISPGDSIQQAIDHAGDGDRIILNPGVFYENNITYSVYVILQANTTAGGNRENTIIDGGWGQARIITSPDTHASPIAIDNLTLRNGHSDRMGGAIHTNGSVTVTSSAFLDCSVVNNESAGGAIASGGPVTVIGSTFSNCSATRIGYAGDAVTPEDIVPFAPSSFSDYFAINNKTSGGAIASGGTVTVISSAFLNCSTHGDGGAISVILGNVTVDSSTFSGCRAHGDGGTIKVLFGNMGVNSSKFVGSSNLGDGGALKVIFGNLTITSSDFINCSTRGDGGTLKVIFGNLEVTSSTFSNSSTHGNGGAISGIFSTMAVTSSTFINTSTHSYGGAIAGIFCDMAVTASTFSNCSTDTNGGAIAGMDSDVTVISSVIANSSVREGTGGAMFFDNSSLDVISSTVTRCSAQSGSIISADTGTIRFSRFVENNGSVTLYSSGGPLVASDNWWGTNSNPSAFVNGTVLYYPWLVLGVTASPATARTGYPVVIRANLTFNSDGYNTSSEGSIQDGIPVAFTVTGSAGLFPVVRNTTMNGVAETTFTPGSGGTAAVTATADGQPVTTMVTAADFVLTLKRGWNFVSTPRKLMPGNDTVAIFKSADTACHSIWQYNTSGQRWIAMVSSYKVNVLDGIWIYSNGTTDIPLWFSHEPLDTPATKPVYAGWNAIGFSDTSNASARDTLLSVQDNWTAAIGYDPLLQHYEDSIINGGSGIHSDTREMIPTRGYWLFMLGPGELSALSA